MVKLATTISRKALTDVRARALAAGAVLGALGWQLSTLPERSPHDLALVLLMLGSGSASFVCHALHRQAERRTPTRRDRLAEARMCVSLLGCGIALAMHALQALLG